MAGFAGHYRVGEALALRMVAESRESDASGLLEVAVDGVIRLRGPVALPDPSRKTLHAALELARPARRIDARIVAHGEVLASDSVELRPRPTAAELRARVGYPAAEPLFRDALEVTVRRDDLPASWAGYTGLTALTLPGSAGLRDDQERALIDWALLGGDVIVEEERPEGSPPFVSELRSALAAGVSPWDGQSAGPEPAPIDPRPLLPLSLFLGSYACAAGLTWTACARRIAGAPWTLVAVLGTAVAATAAAGALGFTVQKGRTLLRESVEIHVFAYGDEAFLDARATTLSPRGRRLGARALLRRARIEAEPSGGDPAPQPLEAGVVLRGRPWGRRDLRIQGFAETGLDIERIADGGRRLVNRSPYPLRECRRTPGGAWDLPEGPVLPDLPPGGTSTVPASAVGTTPVTVRCILVGELSTVTLDAPTRRRPGPAIVLFHLPAREVAR